MARQRVAQIVSEAAQRASKSTCARGLPPLPHLTPHSLRRTYISIALLANNFDVLWVTNQVGHTDSKMTMDVYAQLQQRAKRDHGASFDRLVRETREQMRAEPLPAGFGTGNGTTAPKTPPNTPQRPRPERGQNLRISRQKAKWRDSESNRGHHDFQSCALPTELSRRGPDLNGSQRNGSQRRRATMRCGAGRRSRVGLGALCLHARDPSGQPVWDRSARGLAPYTRSNSSTSSL